MPQLEEANAAITDINSGFGKAGLIEQILWNDEWANWKDEKVKLHLEDEVQKAIAKRNEISNNIKAVQILCKSLKSDYDLQSELNYELILEDRIFTESLETLEKRLEKFAEQQQIAEIEAAEKAAAEEIRKAEKKAEQERIAAEERQREEIRKAEENIRAEQEAIRKQEEKARLEREAILRREAIAELEAKKAEQEAKVTPTNDSKSTKTKDITLFFENLSIEKAKRLLQFIAANNIKYEVV